MNSTGLPRVPNQQLQKERRSVKVEPSVRNYIVKIARATRFNNDITLGASPRASLALYQSAQAWAAIQAGIITFQMM